VPTIAHETVCLSVSKRDLFSQLEVAFV